MNPIILYLLQFIACSGIFYGYYHVMLRNRRFHHYNRFYLIFAVCASLTIPLLSIPIQFSTVVDTPAIFGGSPDIVYSDRIETETIGTAISDTGFTWGITETLWTVYAIVCLLLITRIIVALRKIRQLLKRYPIQSYKSFSLVNTHEEGTPFSFFKWLFWNENLSINSPEGEKIFRHELYHIRNRHSWDLMFLEFISAIAWMNPFIHLIKKELSAIHEFLADEDALRNSGREQYAELLLMQALGTYNRITNPFFHNQIKRRIIMITNSPKPGYRYFRKLMALPIAAIAFILFAFRFTGSHTETVSVLSENSLTVVIDAGHGYINGTPSGAVSENLYEDDLTLKIASKVKELNTNNNLKILLTRSSTENISLAERVSFAETNAADLFISLHIAADPEKSANGIEVVLPGKNQPYYPASQKFGSLLTQHLSGLHNTSKSLKQRKTQVFVLDRNICAAVLLECGYITNEKDRGFLKNEKNIDALAVKILAALNSYALNNQPTKRVISDTIEAPVQPSAVSAVPRPSTASAPAAVPSATPSSAVAAPSRVSRAAVAAPTSSGLKPAARPSRVSVPDTIPSNGNKPEYPGGLEAWKHYIRNKMDLTHGDILAPGTYTVTVRFIVEKNGEVTNVDALSMKETKFAQHCKDLVKQSGKWNPALKNNVPVRAWQEQKFTLVIADEIVTN